MHLATPSPSSQEKLACVPNPLEIENYDVLFCPWQPLFLIIHTLVVFILTFFGSVSVADVAWF